MSHHQPRRSRSERRIVRDPVAVEGPDRSRMRGGPLRVHERGYEVRRMADDSPTGVTRSVMAYQSLQAGFEEFDVGIGADISFHPEDVENLLAGTICRSFADSIRMSANARSPGPSCRGPRRSPSASKEGWRKSSYGSSGFMLTRRTVFETIQADSTASEARVAG